MSFSALRACIRFSPTLVQDQARSELKATVALFAQQAAKAAQGTVLDDFRKLCDYSEKESAFGNAIADAILSLVPDPNALTAHDAALLNEAWQAKEENIAKLEADNAGLRERNAK